MADQLASLPENPFPLEAVATYGKIVKSFDQLRYMETPLTELTSYLECYPQSAKRYGAAIGLRGGHGSGKTHLLIRLAERAREFQAISPVVLYAKADKANFYDLYFQLMSGLPREELVRYLNLAMTNIAIKHVQQAKATESLSDRIHGPEDLPKLYDEGNIAKDQLLKTLQERLEETKVPVEIPRILLQIDHSTSGERAYQWLIGKDILKPEDLGLSRSLLNLERARVDGNNPGLQSAAPDVTAVDALETISVLLALAECPLIILIDQLEVLFRVDDKERKDTLFSVIKKFVEQLKDHNVLIFLTGSDEAWEVPRDVTPRLRQRDPLIVGNLTAEETQNLLDSYTSASKSKGNFSADNASVINQLSGGSPRESIRIAHHAFNEVKGVLKDVDEPLLIACAAKAGSIADRNLLALQQAESVLAPFGMLIKDLEVQDGVLIDYLLMVERVGVLALVTAKATDKLSEVDSARRIQSVSSYLRQKYPQARLIVVSVGYSSSEVQKLLSTTSTVIQFNERQFPHQLKTKVTEIVAESYSKPAEVNGKGNDVILDAVNKIVSRLDKLEVERSKEAKDVAERFSEKADDLNRPVRAEREMKTRFEVRDALDGLEEVLLRGWQSWTDGPWRRGRWEEERQRIKSILVSSEANLNIRQFDDVGVIYQDLLAEERSFWKELDKFETKKRSQGAYGDEFPEFSSWESYQREEDPRWILLEILKLRQDIITTMRRLLQGPTALDKLFQRPWVFSLIPALLVCFVWLLLLSVLNPYFLTDLSERYSLSWILARVILLSVPVYSISLFVLFIVGNRRGKVWKSAANRIRNLIRFYEKTAS